jgi:hypothetical protein
VLDRAGLAIVAGRIWTGATQVRSQAAPGRIGPDDTPGDLGKLQLGLIPCPPAPGQVGGHGTENLPVVVGVASQLMGDRSPNVLHRTLTTWRIWEVPETFRLVGIAVRKCAISGKNH